MTRFATGVGFQPGPGPGPVSIVLETVDRGATPAAAGELPIAGSRLGRYTILDEIGRGAMATVYAAYDDQLDRKVAIKLIRDPDTRVEGEARAAARLSHANVIQIYEIGRFAGHDYLAMELVDGISLATWQRVRSRSVHEIIAKYAQAGRGLAAAHHAGLVHRDFKPDNVLIDGSGRARVGDFGLACPRELARVGQAGALMGHPGHPGTGEDSLVGTPAYMAPEQLLGSAVDERADQFALCAGLYEAVYGVRPLRGGSVEGLRASARAGVLQPPPPGVVAPAALLGLLQRGLAIDPAERWPSLAELLDRLDRLDARRDPAAAGRERRRLVVAVAGVCSVGVGVQMTIAGEAAMAPIEVTVGIVAAVLAIIAVGVYVYRAALLGNVYHRRMIGVVLAAITGYLGILVIGGVAGLPVERILLIELLAMGHMFLLAAPLVAPMLGLNCVIPWIGAVAVGFGAPLLATSTVCWMLCVAVLAWRWSYVPSERRILSPGAVSRLLVSRRPIRNVIGGGSPA